MLKRELRAFAAELGFARTYVCDLPDYSRWRERVDAMPDAHFAHLTDDVKSVFPGDCRVVLLLVYPYRPYADAADGATVSAYYPASDEANRLAAEVEKWLQQRGFRALNRPNIPYKPIAAQAGIARYGRNGVTAIDGLGSRYVLQIVLTDAPLEPDLASGSAGLSESCANCGRCVQACPVGALDGSGRVDVKKCIRARSDEYPLAEEYRPLIGRRLYGCDICQDVCPRNAGIGRTETPPELLQALKLEKLLVGDVAGLAPFIGRNYARKARMQAKACVIAANMGRGDLLPLIEKCEASPVDFVRNHAAWAREQLKNR